MLGDPCVDSTGLRNILRQCVPFLNGSWEEGGVLSTTLSCTESAGTVDYGHDADGVEVGGAFS